MFLAGLLPFDLGVGGPVAALVGVCERALVLEGWERGEGGEVDDDDEGMGSDAPLDIRGGPVGVGDRGESENCRFCEGVGIRETVDVGDICPPDEVGERATESTGVAMGDGYGDGELRGGK